MMYSEKRVKRKGEIISKTMPLLPEEILFDEILARLPVKSLSRFKCVSKPWRSLIESDSFIKIHYRNSEKNPRVLMVSRYGEGMGGCSLQWLLNKSKGEVSNPITVLERKKATLVGCCNGVVCFFDSRDYRRFTLWNLATRVYVELPHYGRGPYLGKSGFGWDESTGAYKVFAVLSDGVHHPEGVLYSSNSNSWRTISIRPGSASLAGRCGRGVFLRGNLHWLDRRHYQIECFDLGREEFGRIELPLICSSYNAWLWLGVIGGNLSILIDSEKSSDVWVMKEYGLKDSWIKILTFPFTPSWTTIHSTCPLFGECPNAETFLIYGETLMIYSPKVHAFSWATNKVSVSITDFLVYVESLVSPETILGAATTTR